MYSSQQISDDCQPLHPKLMESQAQKEKFGSLLYYKKKEIELQPRAVAQRSLRTGHFHTWHNLQGFLSCCVFSSPEAWRPARSPRQQAPV